MKILPLDFIISSAVSRVTAKYLTNWHRLESALLLGCSTRIKFTILICLINSNWVYRYDIVTIVGNDPRDSVWFFNKHYRTININCEWFHAKLNALFRPRQSNIFILVDTLLGVHSDTLQIVLIIYLIIFI